MFGSSLEKREETNALVYLPGNIQVFKVSSFDFEQCPMSGKHFIEFVKGLQIIQVIQQASLILGRFGFYDMICGYFDQLKVLLKVMLRTWLSGSKQI